MTIDLAAINVLSDTVLYEEAKQFLSEHSDTPERSQLQGLLTYSRNWRDLTGHIGHQSERDWINKGYRNFYKALKDYLTGLRQRVESEFKLVPEGLARKAKREVQDRWAEVLAQEFLQHLVAHAQFQKTT